MTRRSDGSTPSADWDTHHYIDNDERWATNVDIVNIGWANVVYVFVWNARGLPEIDVVTQKRPEACTPGLSLSSTAGATRQEEIIADDDHSQYATPSQRRLPKIRAR